MISSIIIPVYNQRESYLRAAIASAITQSVAVEVVVVDDGSDVSIEPIIADVATTSVVEPDDEGNFSTITMIHQENGGVASALNAGINVATGEYIQWLSSDDLFRRDKTEKQVNLLRRADSPICYCGYEEGVPQAATTWAAAQYPNRETFYHLLSRHCFVNACTVMWHKNVFDEVGLFDPEYRHAQDLEMLLRCAERWNFQAINEPLVRRRVHPEQMINTLKNPEEAEYKRQELEKINVRYGASIALWVPGGER